MKETPADSVETAAAVALPGPPAPDGTAAVSAPAELPAASPASPAADAAVAADAAPDKPAKPEKPAKAKPSALVQAAKAHVTALFARELYNATQALRRDLSILEIRIGTDYVRYDRLQDAFKPVMDSLHEIKQTLAGKADK